MVERNPVVLRPTRRQKNSATKASAQSLEYQVKMGTASHLPPYIDYVSVEVILVNEAQQGQIRKV